MVRMTDNSDAFLFALNEKSDEILKEIAESAEKYAKDMCPVDTGRLKKSIKSEIDGSTLTISANTEYAAAVELGTSTRKAQPFIKPAMSKYSAEYKKIAEKIMKS